jgi:Na+/glutamate symporter
VDDRSRAIAAATVGAVAGGIAGYMLFTDRGRELRRQLEPAIEDFARELVQLRGTVNRAMGVASQGWHVLNEALGERGQTNAFPSHHQSNPF